MVGFEIRKILYSMLGQKKLMNSFSGQISEILMRQAGIFYFFLLKISLQSIMLLSCCVLTAICIEQTKAHLIPTLLGFKI